MERAIHIKHCVHCGKPTAGKTSKTMFCSGACRVAVYRLKKKGFTKYGYLSYPTKDHEQTMRDLLKDDKYEFLTYKRENVLNKGKEGFSEIVIYKRSLK
jgi:predicted nucleic acid-binding Zn ribbon protein